TAGNAAAGHGERRGGGRMAMDARLHVRSLFVDRQMQEHLAGPLFCSGKLLPLVIDLADVLALHEALADHRGRAEDFAAVQAERDVAIIGRRKATTVNPPADLTHLFFEFVFVHGSLPLLALRARRSVIVNESRMQAPYASTGFFSG